MDVETQVAEPSHAPVVDTHSEAVELPAAGTAEYAEWRQSGKTPEKKAAKDQPVKDDSASSKSAGDKPEKGAPVSETGKDKTQETRRRGDAETRLSELLADLKTAGLSPSELKTFKREVQQAKTDVKAEPSTAAKVEPQTQGPKAPEKPDYKAIRDKAKNWDEGEAAVDAAREEYFEKLADFKAAQAVANDRAQQRQEQATREMQQKLDDAKVRYGAEAESKIISSAQTIFNDNAVSQAVKIMLGSSSVITDLLFVMGSKADEFQQFVDLSKRDAAAAVRKLVVYEQLVQAELAKGAKQASSGESTDETRSEGTPERGADGKFQAKQPPERKETKASPPPVEVNGRSAPPPDEEASALAAIERGDGTAFARFREDANRRDIARRKGL